MHWREYTPFLHQDATSTSIDPARYSPLTSASITQIALGAGNSTANVYAGTPAATISAIQDYAYGKKCMRCFPGYFSLTSPSRICAECPISMYQIEQGKTACTWCERGKYGYSPGVAKCLLCANGKYADREGSNTCSSCPSGTTGAGT
jgi:hypothetical protein